MIRLLALLLFLATPAAAAPVAVTSGEHAGFTRLVFDFGAALDWRFGRTEDGYELAVPGPAPAYDLTGVFRLIGTSRLAAIWADPVSGNLRIGIACACHAMPFEFRPGIVVVDLRDGPPPKGSSFEAALDGRAQGRLAARPAPRPRARPERMPDSYDWLALQREKRGSPAFSVPLSLPESDLTLAPLRDILLQQLSRGAAQGVVEMARPGAGPRGGTLPDFASAQVRIGGGPPLQSDPTGSVHGDLGAEGASCVAADRLDLAGWGDDRPVSEQWAGAMAGLVGEFDRPDPAALTRAVRFQLYLGFGAEARQLLAAFGADLPDAPLWRAMAHLLDDEPSGSAVFAGQLACDGPAALWAMLDTAGLRPGALVNAPAVRLAFSALPLHLRRLLGPRLAEGFLIMDDAESARAIRDAILRSGASAETAVTVMEAGIDLQNGDPDAAEARLRAAVAAGGPEAMGALADLVEMRARRGLPVGPEDVPALESALAERAGSPEAGRIARALIFARAASGDPAGAFALLPDAPDLEPEVWALLAGLGTDAQLLDLAVLPDSSTPAARPATREQIAARLLDLGLAPAASLWLRDLAVTDPLLRARLDLALGNSRDALRRVAGQDRPEALPLREAALRSLGDGKSLAAVLAAAGDAEGSQRALARGGDWTGLSGAAPSAWQQLGAAATAPDAPPTDTPLAAADQLASASAETRGQITQLLATLPTP